MNSIHSVLLVDDEAVVAHGLQRTLKNFRFEVQLAEDSETALKLIKENQFDIVLVDFDLGPKGKAKQGMSGHGLVQALRVAGVTLPILMYTVLEGEWYELAALQAGADGYILKTTSVELLISRLLANIRRHERDTGKRKSATHKLGIGRFVLDRSYNVLATEEKSILVTPKESRILEILATNPSRVISPKELLDGAWGGKDLDKSVSALNAVIKRFRKKLGENGVADLIENVRGQGFRLVSPMPLSVRSAQPTAQ
jgi:DNA-binding response OmpR family regulator